MTTLYSVTAIPTEDGRIRPTEAPMPWGKLHTSYDAALAAIVDDVNRETDECNASEPDSGEHLAHSTVSDLQDVTPAYALDDECKAMWSDVTGLTYVVIRHVVDA